MKCESCGKTIVNENQTRYVADLEVCRPCYRDLLSLTRETGGEAETVEEMNFETFVDSVVGVYA